MDLHVTKEIVTYTIWHWESLLSDIVDPAFTVPYLVNSFDALMSLTL